MLSDVPEQMGPVSAISFSDVFQGLKWKTVLRCPFFLPFLRMKALKTGGDLAMEWGHCEGPRSSYAVSTAQGVPPCWAARTLLLA